MPIGAHSTLMSNDMSGHLAFGAAGRLSQPLVRADWSNCGGLASHFEQTREDARGPTSHSTFGDDAAVPQGGGHLATVLNTKPLGQGRSLGHGAEREYRTGVRTNRQKRNPSRRLLRRRPLQAKKGT